MKHKKLFLLIISLATLFASGYGQDTTRQWNVLVYDETLLPTHPFPTWDTYIQKTIGDTLINDTLYQKLYVSHDSLFANKEYKAAIRFDSSRIFVRFSHDELFYDFNLEDRDTAEVYHGGYNRLYHVRIDSTDSVEMGGIQRKRLFVTYFEEGHDVTFQDIWIEGMGSKKDGLLLRVCYFCTGNGYVESVLCYKENDRLLYSDTAYNTCFYQNVETRIKQKPPTQSLHIYPTILTSSRVVHIHAAERIKCIRVFNVQGREVCRRTPNVRSLSLHLNQLNAGVYILKIDGETRKIMVSD